MRWSGLAVFVTLITGNVQVAHAQACFDPSGGQEGENVMRRQFEFGEGSSRAKMAPVGNSKPNFIGWLWERGIHLCRSVTGAGRGEGATLSLTRSGDGGTVFTSDFALSIEHNAWRSGKWGEIELLASVDGSLSSSESQTEDALTFQAGMKTDLTDDSPIGMFLTQNQVFSVSPQIMFETDQLFDNQRVLLDLEMFLVDKELWLLGKPKIFFAGSKEVSVSFEPSLNIDTGYNIMSITSSETENIVFRVNPTVALNFEIPIDKTNGSTASISATNRFIYMPLESDGINNFTEVTGNFDFGSGLSVSAIYRTGQPPPTFAQVDSISINVGVQF